MKQPLLTPATRRIIYSALAALLGVLGVTGVLTTEQADLVTANIEPVLEALSQILGALGLIFAAFKANPAADDPTTRQDLEDAVAGVQASYENQTAPTTDLLEQIVSLLPKTTLLSSTPQPYTDGANLPVYTDYQPRHGK